MSKKQKKNLKRIIISLILFFILFITNLIKPLESFIPYKFGWFLPLGLYFTIYVYIGHDVLKKAFKNIKNGQIFDENFLMSIATLGAFGLAIYRGVEISQGKDVKLEGFDEACAVLLFYQVGEFFQSMAVSKSRKSISSLMDIRPDYANFYLDGSESVVDPDILKIGDLFIVHPGEKIPLDGVIVKGFTSLDTKSLTGESKPIDVATGDNVISGSVNVSSDIIVKASKEFYDSTVSKILDLVENASTNKSEAENFITKFARYYTPVVTISAVLLAIIPSVVNGFMGDWTTWSRWIYSALSFLVVSCPCALVISVPLSFVSGIGAASHHGILVKGANYLEMFNKANIFAFDKTGTLTSGTFKVTNIIGDDQTLKYAAIAEQNSSHPIALSIKEAYADDIDSSYQISNEAGYGIIAKNDINTILCGSYKMMEKHNVICNESSDFGTKIYVAKNGIYLGLIIISDTIKEDAYNVISYLNNNSYKSIMLTGDNEHVANNVAASLGLSSYKAELLPQNKVEVIDEILSSKNNNDKLCFVGDGINDAPVLVKSDIGIAMGALGSDAAIEASDIVLMNDDLNGIIIAKKIAKKTMQIVYENIIFALGIKLLILLLAAFDIAGMWIAVFGDVGVAVLAILNAMRVNKKYK